MFKSCFVEYTDVFINKMLQYFSGPESVNCTILLFRTCYIFCTNGNDSELENQSHYDLHPLNKKGNPSVMKHK